MEPIRVTAGVITENNRVLITRRGPKENNPGGWEFPGGKIEPGETPQECLARELKEELSIDVTVDKFCAEVIHDYGQMSIKLIAYYCSIIDGEIQISVHDKYQWVKINELLEYDLLPADVPIAKKVVEEYKNDGCARVYTVPSPLAANNQG